MTYTGISCGIDVMSDYDSAKVALDIMIKENPCVGYAICPVVT